MSTQSSRDQLKIVIVGHVDHGKSTLVGRIFHDTGSLPDGKYEQIKAMCEKRGMPFEWSFLMDALQAERDQGITIDTAQIWFRTQKRDYVIIDAPGHKEFLKNMVSGAAQSDAALLVIDAHEGVKEQSKRHGYLLHLLGVRQIAVAVNKMDLVGYSAERFAEIERDYRAYLASIGVTPTYIIPISGREGDGITAPSPNMPWYTGPSVVEALDHFTPTPALEHLPLRFPVQDVYKFDQRRIIAGRIESGSLRVGDTLLFSPDNKTVKVASIETWSPTPTLPSPSEGEGRVGVGEVATAGQSIGITLEDQIFVERGHIASHTDAAPRIVSHFKAKLFWLGREPLTPGKRYTLKIATTKASVEVKSIDRVISTDDLATTATTQVAKSEVAEVTFRVRGLLALDDYADNAKLGRFVLVDGYDVAGGGIIDLAGITDLRVASHQVKSKNLSIEDTGISAADRARMNGHKGGILWFTGLSGSGKSTLAKELQHRLFARGLQTYVLDGDNVRKGLNADLGFTHDDRAENIRRVGEVAALFADAGVIVITAFISPYREDRRRARSCAPEAFHSIYIKADLQTCETRDPKGLYKKARKGEITHFTGISDPYEEPENPELEVDTSQHSIEECVELLVKYVERELVG
ncbi:MAG: adenylyl-sulfate kinase [Alphaproteobacteria bacterium]|nr:adenylyl-sulfate kinase [Alphaproteobacteria bacterium]